VARQNYSILYVDDELPLCDLCRIYLEERGDFLIEAAETAEEALGKLQDRHFDAVVSDYQMPGMDGIAFLKEVRVRYGDVPFILFTGRGREEIVIEAIRNGADFYVQKGGDPRTLFADLAHMIRNAVGKRRVAEELRASEARQRLLQISVDRASDEVYWLDFRGQILYVNDSACRNTGYSRDELLAMTIFELDPDFTPELLARSREILREKKTRVFTTRHRHKDGTIVDVEIMSNYVEHDGRDYSFAFARNITERKRTEDELRESEERYRRLLAQSFDAVILHQEGKIVFANAAAARMVKAESPSLMIGRPTLDFVDARCADLVNARIRTMTETGAAVPLVEERFRCVDGSTVDVEVAATGALFAGRPAIQVVGRDITARKQTEKALREANRKLKLLTSVTRHDILNRLTAMSAHLELAKYKKPDPALVPVLETLESQAGAIRKLIEFTSVYQEPGSMEPRWQELLRVLPAFPPGLALSLESGAVSLYADPILEKIFANLLDNTLRHGGNATTVRVFFKESPDGLTVVWEDDGKGIPAGEKGKIFGEGYGNNTGLGLFLSREILSTTGITIRETGEPGRGARFELLVPKGGYRIGTVGGQRSPGDLYYR